MLSRYLVVFRWWVLLRFIRLIYSRAKFVLQPLNLVASWLISFSLSSILLPVGRSFPLPSYSNVNSHEGPPSSSSLSVCRKPLKIPLDDRREDAYVSSKIGQSQSSIPWVLHSGIGLNSISIEVSWAHHCFQTHLRFYLNYHHHEDEYYYSLTQISWSFR